jgi:hypothetical protein
LHLLSLDYLRQRLCLSYLLRLYFRLHLLSLDCLLRHLCLHYR